jgi:hypothetical protein
MMSGSETRLPYFRLFAAEFLSLEMVTAMDAAELGVFVRLLCHAWANDGLPQDRKIVERVAQASEAVVERVLALGFTEGSGGRLRCPWQEIERAWAQGRSVKAQASARTRWDGDGSPQTPLLKTEEKREEDTRRDNTRSIPSAMRTQCERNANASNNGNGFDDFWKAYPRKVAKQDAEKAWSKLKPDAELQRLIRASVERQAQSKDWRKDGGQFIPYPATWLNGKRWVDEANPMDHPAANIFGDGMDDTGGL